MPRALCRFFHAQQNPSLPFGFFTGRRRPVVTMPGRASSSRRETGTLRGIWNLKLNSQTVARFSSGPPRPVNEILAGAIHTVHRPDGSLVDPQTYWYEPTVRRYLPAVDLTKKWDSITSEERVVRHRIRRSNYGANLASALSRYARALDGSDYESSFLKLWGLLEFLTHTESARYEDTIKRCLFATRDRELERQVLEHLRDRRNHSVHAAPSRESFGDDLLYQLKGYVEWLLKFHLFSRPSFRSLADAAEFLSLPHDPAEYDNG